MGSPWCFDRVKGNGREGTCSMAGKEDIEVSEHGIFARHPDRTDFSGSIAPATTDQFNTLREPIVPIACALLPERHFEFDSSFVKPDVAEGLKRLAVLRNAHPGSPASVFGHADPVGDDNYNKTLSGRRARAIYALLIRDASIWEDLFSHPFGRDKWGLRSMQSMLSTLGFNPGRVDGVEDDNARNAVKSFQRQHGLPESGSVDASTREKIFLAYMDSLYGGVFTPLDKKADFLGRNADADGKADYQGCGEFNPILMFSKAENEKFQKATNKSDRDLQNAPNRRALVYLFKPGASVDLAKWPCPRAKEGIEGCKKRFFSDADKRRSFQERTREYKDTRDTFACRFYDRMAHDSPCERRLRLLRIRLFDAAGAPMPGAPFLAITGARRIRDTTTLQGDALIHDIELPADCHLFWSAIQPGQEKPSDPVDFEFHQVVHLDAETDDDAHEGDESVVKKLQNLGYARSPDLEQNVIDFQIDTGAQITGVLKDVRAEVQRRFRELDPPRRSLPSGARRA